MSVYLSLCIFYPSICKSHFNNSYIYMHISFNQLYTLSNRVPDPVRVSYERVLFSNIERASVDFSSSCNFWIGHNTGFYFSLAISVNWESFQSSFHCFEIIYFYTKTLFIFLLLCRYYFNMFWLDFGLTYCDLMYNDLVCHKLLLNHSHNLLGFNKYHFLHERTLRFLENYLIYI